MVGGRVLGRHRPYNVWMAHIQGFMHVASAAAKINWIWQACKLALINLNLEII